MTYTNTVIKQCPGALELEQHFLSNTNDHNSRAKRAGHINQCPYCRKKLHTLDGIYEFTVKELPVAVSGKVLDLACRLTCLPVQKGYFHCIPAQEKIIAHVKAYQMKMLLTENSAATNTFSGAGDDILPGADFSIRVIADPASQSVCLYFNAKQPVDFDNYTLSIPGIIENAGLSGNGTAELPFFRIDELNNKFLHFIRKEKSYKKQKFIRQFQKCLPGKHETVC
ncbi:MAG TPA: hypothetical protein PLP19_12485 [bacterium]|nr:hypothetical protein [bacterium]HPN44302.1 hypothetical protein [bacterium]